MEFDCNILAEKLKTLPEIAFAYIFGSAQNGTIKKGSDLDIAVYMISSEKNGDKETGLRLKIIQLLESAIPGFDNFDVVVLNETSTILGMQALQGKLLFVKSEYEDLHAEFYSFTCRKFEYDSFWMKKNQNTEDMGFNGIIEKKLSIIEEKVDAEIVYSIIKNKLNLFEKFVEEIR